MHSHSRGKTVDSVDIQDLILRVPVVLAHGDGGLHVRKGLEVHRLRVRFYSVTRQARIRVSADTIFHFIKADGRHFSYYSTV